MSHTVTWRCPWCKKQYASILGSKFVYRNGVKRRKCANCLKGESND